MYYPGDNFECTVSVFNEGNSTLQDHPLFMILDVFGEYFFAPGFSNYDHYTSDYPPGETEFVVIPAFNWPTDAGNAQDIKWYAAPGITDLISNLSTWTFGWSD
ncbi:hypothetical protein K8T06_15050 [bacterium]|nr:hypothetical protein [bacterium]